MAFYRFGEPAEDGPMHVNFGRKAGPAPCREPRLEGDNPNLGEFCHRMSVALCDGPGGQDLSGKPLTCDKPLCEKHRRRGTKPNTDYCARHAHPSLLEGT